MIDTELLENYKDCTVVWVVLDRRGENLAVCISKQSAIEEAAFMLNKDADEVAESEDVLVRALPLL